MNLPNFASPFFLFTLFVKNLNNLNELTSFNAKYGHGENQPSSRSKLSDSDEVLQGVDNE